jgi:hypothetical protein
MGDGIFNYECLSARAIDEEKTPLSIWRTPRVVVTPLRSNSRIARLKREAQSTCSTNDLRTRILLPHNLRSPMLLLPSHPILQPANLRRLLDLLLLASIAIPEEVHHLFANTLLPLGIFGRLAVLVLRQTRAPAARFGFFFAALVFAALSARTLSRRDS